MPEALGSGVDLVRGRSGLEWVIKRAQGGNKEAAGAWMIYAAASIDLFSDGLMIGVGSVVSFTLAVVLAIDQVTADVPDGFAAIANFNDKGISRWRWFILSTSCAASCLSGATVGYWLLRHWSEAPKLVALAFTAGILLIAPVEEMLEEAHKAAQDTSYSALFFILGFGLFTLIASYLE